MVEVDSNGRFVGKTPFYSGDWFQDTLDKWEVPPPVQVALELCIEVKVM